MKLFLLLVPLLAALCSAGNKLCGANKFPGVNNAIGKFCQNTKLMVPSQYSVNGMSGNNGKGLVQIVGTCNPPQWVPQGYCMEQFNNMCRNGVTSRRFGRNKCQNWKIRYGPPPVKQVTKTRVVNEWLVGG